MNQESHITGSCLCKAVKFTLTLPSKWCAHCHCSQCRKAHGAGFVTWIGFVEGQFQLDLGEEALRWYASSPPARRGFCSKCGSTLFFQSTQWPDEMHVALACLDEEADRKPQAHVFAEHSASWINVDPELPVHVQGSE